MRAAVLTFVTLLSFACTSAASQINPISLAELESRATHIVLAKVTKVEAMGNQDNVSIEVSSFLKGQSDEKTFTFALITRGGIKDFDPQLKVGDAGVFFLKANDLDRNLAKAYWGSMAIFPRNYFDQPDKKDDQPAPNGQK